MNWKRVDEPPEHAGYYVMTHPNGDIAVVSWFFGEWTTVDGITTIFEPADDCVWCEIADVQEVWS